MSLASTELTLYIDNTQRLWKVKRDVWARLARRKVKQDYDSELAVRAFMYVANQGAKAYVREQKMSEKWSTAFPAADRKCVATQYEKEFRALWKTGELDYLLPLKMRPKRRNVTGNPVRRGYTRKVISDNVSTLVREGKSQKQAIAIALEVARDSFRARFPGRPLPGYLSSPPATTTTRKKAAKKKTRRKKSASKTRSRSRREVEAELMKLRKLAKKLERQLDKTRPKKAKKRPTRKRAA